MSCSPANHMRPGTQSCGIARADLWASGVCMRVLAFSTPAQFDESILDNERGKGDN